MAERYNVPGGRSIATVDKNREKHFKQFQGLGYIPKDYKDWDNVQEHFLYLTTVGGLSDVEAANAMGVDYKNVIGSNLLKLELSSTGKVRGINMRSLREDIKPDERAYVTQRYGESFLEDLVRLRELEWGDKKPKRGEDVEALKERVYSALDGGAYSRDSSDPDFESAKTQADRARDRLATSFGKTSTARGAPSQVHRGHGVAAMDGAGVGTSNLVDEWGPLNVGHGSAPRFDPRVMRSLNMSDGDLQALYDGYLKHRGLDINPVRYSGNYVAADESLRELQQGTNLGNPQITVPVEANPRVSQDSIEWRDRRFYETERQMAANMERNGLSPADATSLARQKMQNMAYSQSTLFDTTQSHGGPVRIVRAADPVPREVTVQPLTPQTTDPMGRALPTPKMPKPFKVSQPHVPPQEALRIGSVPNLPVRGGITGGLATGAALGFLMGESPAQAIASNIPILSDIESDNNGMAERVGQQMFVDPRTNRLMPTSAEQIGKGLAYLNGKPIAVPYGSVAGTKSNGDILKETVGHIADVNRKRVNKVAKAAKPALRTAAQLMPKPLQAFQPLVDAYRGFNKIINSIIRD